MQDDRGDSIVLVELDALLDTRLPTLGSIHPQFAVKASEDKRYYGRIIDDFTEICGVDKHQFRQTYEARSMDILRASLITEIPFILNELVTKLEREAIDTPFLSRVKVEINCYPYELDADEKEGIALAVSARCGQEAEVSCVWLTPEQMTPAFLKMRYSGMFIYNFRTWMEKQMKAFESVKMPRFTVMAPALFYDEIPGPDEFAKDGIAAEITAFQLTEVGLTELFSLTLLPAANFSMARVPGYFKGAPIEKAPEPVITGDLNYHVK